MLSGPRVIRVVRSPGVFPKPNLPIVMLTAWAQRSRLFAVHEFLLKPTSPKALRDRLLSILIKPRPMVQIGEHYAAVGGLRRDATRTLTTPAGQTRADSRQTRNRPDPTTTADPASSAALGTSPQTTNPSTAAQTSER